MAVRKTTVEPLRGRIKCEYCRERIDEGASLISVPDPHGERIYLHRECATELRNALRLACNWARGREARTG